MNLDTFFKKFELFADAPNAVTKMRGLILDLAIRGQLLPVHTSPIDGCQSDWPTLPLGSIASLITKGATPTSYGYPYESSGIPFVKVENIKDGSIQNSSIEQFISSNAHDFLGRSQLAENDILFSIAGTIGKTCIVFKKDIPANTNQALAIIRGVDKSFNIVFLKMQLDSFVANKIKEKARGGAMLNVSLSDLRNLLVTVPPLAEQKRIVAKVDELMALCDLLEAQQHERETRHTVLAHASLTRFTDTPTPANLELLFHRAYVIEPAELRKMILTLAVQGKLVSQDPSDESAESWLKSCQMKTLRTRTNLKDQQHADERIPISKFEIPHGWTWLQVSDVFEVAGGIQKTPLRDPRDNSYPYLGVGNVYRGRLDLTHIKKFQLEPGELERRKLEKGDLLVIEGNGSFNEIGRCAKWNAEILNCVHQNHVIRCRPINVEISDFVLLFLNSPAGMEIMQRLAITSSGLYSLSVGKIRQIGFPLPPLPEQRRIVAKVDQLMVLVDQLEAQLVDSRAKAAAFLDAVVAELSAAA